MYYAFGNYKLTPRNNADYANVTVSVETVSSTEVETSLYPNPTADRVMIQVDKAYSFNKLNVQVLDMTGRVVLETQTNQSLSSIELASFDRGVYLVRISNNNELIHSSKLILK